MQPLNIKPTSSSPEIFLNAETGIFSFTGRSYPDHAASFYEPVYEYLKQYALHPAAKTECTFQMEYMNSSSRKCMMDILKILESINMKTHSVTVIWNYEEDDEYMKETGEEYKNLFRLNFQIRSSPESS